MVEYFTHLFNEHNELNNEHIFNEENETTNETLDTPSTASEIRNSIMDLKNNKSPGIDGIPSEFFKVATEKLVPYFEILFNEFYENLFFPEDWSTSLITPIHKKGDTNNPNNYRGFICFLQMTLLCLPNLKLNYKDCLINCMHIVQNGI